MQIERTEKIDRCLEVRLLRSRLKMTRTEFSKLIGYHIQTVRDWENGRTIPKKPIMKYLAMIEKNQTMINFSDLEEIINSLSYVLSYQNIFIKSMYDIRNLLERLVEKYKIQDIQDEENDQNLFKKSDNIPIPVPVDNDGHDPVD